MKCVNTTMNRPNCVNVIVTQTQLVASLTKVLLFGLGPIFDVENIYSAAKCGKNFLRFCELLRSTDIFLPKVKRLVLIESFNGLAEDLHL